MSQLGLSQDATEPRQSPRPILTRSIVAVGAFVFTGLADLLMMLFHARRIQLLKAVQSHTPVSRDDLVSSDLAILFGSRLTLLLLVVTAVAFLMWFHRASQNIRAFQPGPFEFSTGRAVWSFFVPFANLIWPHGVMREIWQASDPSWPDGGEHFSATRVSPLVHIWWALFLGRGFLGWVAFLPFLSSHDLESLLLSSQLYEVALALSIACAAAASLLVFLIQGRQEALTEHLSRPVTVA